MHVSETIGETEALFNNDQGERDRGLFILYRSSESTTLTLSERRKSKVTLVCSSGRGTGSKSKGPFVLPYNSINCTLIFGFFC